MDRLWCRSDDVEQWTEGRSMRERTTRGCACHRVGSRESYPGVPGEDVLYILLQPSIVRAHMQTYWVPALCVNAGRSIHEGNVVSR